MLTAPVVYERGSLPRASITSLKPLTEGASSISSRRQLREGVGLIPSYGYPHPTPKTLNKKNLKTFTPP